MSATTGPQVEIVPGRRSEVGTLPVQRLLPGRRRRTVGAWCFADHMGPLVRRPRPGTDAAGIGPHPHTGLQTVTWLVAGELVHRDSLGSEQSIRPGQLNLMTAGHGVAHAEEDPGAGDTLHGVQLWVAQPEATRHGAPAFEHHPSLPSVSMANADATVLVGSFGGATSPARCDTEHVGVELVLRPGRTVLPLRGPDEHALLVLEGEVAVAEATDSVPVQPGWLGYLGVGRQECALDVTAPARLLLLGGVPFPEPLVMWWNFVARTREEISEAADQWDRADPRFGTVASSLQRIGAGRPWWERGALP